MPTLHKVANSLINSFFNVVNSLLPDRDWLQQIAEIGLNDNRRRVPVPVCEQATRPQDPRCGHLTSSRDWYSNVAARMVLFMGLLLGGTLELTATEEPAATEEQRRSVAVALNYSRAALHRIRRNPSVRVMMEEQEKILNHLDLNGIADDEVLKLYSSVLDEISNVQIAERERVVLRERYTRAFQRDLGLNTFEIAAQVATAQYVSAVRTGANSWWDHRNQAATHELDIWQVDKKHMSNVVDKSSQFLDVSWKMARAKKIPDRWLVRGDGKFYGMLSTILVLRGSDSAVDGAVICRQRNL